MMSDAGAEDLPVLLDRRTSDAECSAPQADLGPLPSTATLVGMCVDRQQQGQLARGTCGPRGKVT